MLHDRLTPVDLAALPAKAKINPAVVELYLQNDFLTAYAKHTDMRVAESPEGAIGAPSQWETHGDWQRDFLIAQGLLPQHRLLEIGCGTGRLARKVVPYLDFCKYAGVDISQQALAHARSLALEEGWATRGVSIESKWPDGQFHYLWAFSVVIHLPAHVMADVFKECAKRMDADSRFYFSYVPEIADARTGCKQFRHTLGTYKRACREAGLSFMDVPWLHQQRIALARRVDFGPP